MPGVPSGKGCEACRRQKKKCDQLKPLCSRCKRLHLACVGAGEQRYTFKEDRRSSKLNERSKIDDHEQDHNQDLVKDSPGEIVVPILTHLPRNQTTSLANALVVKLNAIDDLRYHLTWNYGGFLEDIPKRLGINKALDASAEALICSHSTLGSHRYGPIPEKSLVAYSNAIVALRQCINDPTKVRRVETLCAIMVLLICQTFLGITYGGRSFHGEGAAQLLKSREFYDRSDEFESKLVLSLRGPVVFEALFNQKISFTTKEWARLVQNELDGSNSEGIMMLCLSKLPNILRRGRPALKEKNEAKLQQLSAETQHQYVIMKDLVNDLLELVLSLEKAAENPDAPAKSVIGIMRAHFIYQRAYGLALSICIAFNRVLRALDPVQASDLDEVAIGYGEEVLRLADVAAKFRPCGAGWVSVCLIAAWCCYEEGETRTLLENLTSDYMSDFPGSLASSKTGLLRSLQDTARLFSLQPYARRESGCCY